MGPGWDAAGLVACAEWLKGGVSGTSMSLVSKELTAGLLGSADGSTGVPEGAEMLTECSD